MFRDFSYFFTYIPSYIKHLSYTPPAYKSGSRPFLRWVRSLDQNPHASGKVKNTFSPVGIPRIRGEVTLNITNGPILLLVFYQKSSSQVTRDEEAKSVTTKNIFIFISL